MLLVDKTIKKYGSYILMILLFIGTIITDGCNNSWYQREEPEGFLEFIRKSWKCVIINLKLEVKSICLKKC